MKTMALEEALQQLDRSVGFCMHEHLGFDILPWTDNYQSMVICQMCDLLMCALPDHYQLA